MIGQRELLRKIDGQIERGKFPKVSILIGEKGSGRKTLASHIDRELNRIFNITKYASEEEAMANKPIVYIFDNCDFIVAQGWDNTIRDKINETPDCTYFILICECLDNIPPDIKNKAVTYMMDSYSDDDKYDFIYCNGVKDLTIEDEEFIIETASNLGEVKQMLSLDVKDLKAYTNYVLDNFITDVIPHETAFRIALNEEEGKFPIRLFWRAFIAICGDRMRTQGNSLMYCRFIAITGDAIQQLIGSDINPIESFASWGEQILEEYNNFRD